MTVIEFDAQGRKLSVEERKEAFKFSAERDKSSLCRMRPGESISDGHACSGRLVVHHIDNDSTNNPTDGSNWMILCAGHNQRCHPHGKVRFNNPKYAKRLSDLRTKLLKSNRIRSESMRRNMIAQPIAAAFIEKIMESNERVELDELISATRREVTLVTEKRFKKGNEEYIGETAVLGYLKPYLNAINGIYQEERDADEKVWIVHRRKV